MQYRVRKQSELKPSGVEWLGDIPNTWSFSRLSYNIKLLNGYAFSSTIHHGDGINIIKMSNLKDGNIIFKDNNQKFNITDKLSKFLLKENDILIGLSGSIENFAVVKNNHLPAYLNQRVCSLRATNNILNQFICYIILSKYFKEQIQVNITGSTIVNLSTESLERVKVLVPNISKQEKIIFFLNKKTQIFDDSISKKEELITKLEKAKQSLISEVVTGKLKVIEKNEKLQTIKREKEELKPSKVEWLGYIPKDWQVKKLGYVFKFKNGVNADSSSYGKGLKFINVKETINTDFILEKDIEGSVNVPESIIKENLLQKGDVLFNRTSETAEEIALSTVYYDDAKALFGGFVIRGRQITNDLDLDFKRYCFQSYEIRKQIISFASGSIRKNIAQTNLKDVYLTFPNIDEQKQISKYLDEKIKTFDNTIEKTKQSITKLKQAKESLISEAVTGKIEIL